MAVPLPTPVGAVKVTFKAELAGAGTYGWSLIIGYSGTSPTTADLGAIAAAGVTAWGASIAPLSPTVFQLREVVAVDLKNPSTVEGTASATTNGTRAGAAMTDGVCGVVVYTPDRRYRGARPKAFLPVGVQGDLANGQQWSATFLTALKTAVQTVISDLVASSPAGVTLTHSVCVFRTGPPYTVVSNSGKTRSHSVGTQLNPPLVVDTLSIDANPKVGSQRRRLGKPF